MWYPGHMAKASRTIEEIKKHIDLVVELLDARAPMATHAYTHQPIKAKKNVIVMGKSDLAAGEVTSRWKDFFERLGQHVFVLDKSTTTDEIVEFVGEHVQKNGLIMVVGVPNVGKSTLINKLKGSRSARVGAMPGITKGLQWFSVTDRFRVLDTPGLLLPKLWSKELAAKLLLVGSLTVDMVPPQIVQKAFEIYAHLVKIQESDLQRFLEGYALERKMLAKGGLPDTERALVNFFNSIAQGKFGRLSFEVPEEVEEHQSDSLSTT
ncbi:GTPase [Pseudothermotoga sp. U03pept]|uniref:GTPase n=1 Tax=Pseudothermotoga sp. U03pept TaxID=3447012 RepID=UPI003EFE1AE4